jgi:hypothetical protein
MTTRAQAPTNPQSSTSTQAAREWAEREFGHADLGDVRRTDRLVTMAARACDRPHGRVAAVFDNNKEREGAYDFLESEHVPPDEIMAAVAEATLKRGAGSPFVFVPVDGTSLTLVDHAKNKDFGVIGTHQFDARGLKVLDALAVDREGVVLGWLALTFWARPQRKLPPKGSRALQGRAVEDKETRYWLETIQQSAALLDAHGVRGWFQMDREADGQDVLLLLNQSAHWWTVRSNADRSIELQDGDPGRLRAELARQPSMGSYPLEVSGRPKRQPRTAQMIVRSAAVTLRLRHKRTGAITRQAVTAVWAREHGTTPDGEQPVDWLLFTNHPVETMGDAQLVVYGYSQRWRVEECHRTWKTGGCHVEATQLQSFVAVRRWAIVLASVATRIERLKRLARTKADQPATLELSPVEIDALILLRFGTLEGHEQPTISEAVLWLAEYGGWAGKYSGKPPGATTIGRGLLHLHPAAKMLEIIRGHEK